MADTTTPILLIGAGPIGLELAVGLKQASLAYTHLEGRQIGHTISWWAPQTRFFSSNDRIAIAGLPLVTPDGSKATREQYLAYLRTVVQHYKLDIRTYEPVSTINPTPAGFEVLTTTPTATHRYLAARVILATGGTETPHLLSIPGEDLPHVSHYLQDPHAYFRRKLTIVGGRNSAVEAALRAHHAGAAVTISYRQASLPEKSIKYWLLPEINSLIKSGAITAHFQTAPERITPTTVALRRASGDVVEVEADHVLLLTGYDADMSLFRAAGVTLLPPADSPTFDPTTMETNVPGLYVAGTAARGSQQSKYELYIENTHTHVHRIIAHLQGRKAHTNAPEYSLSES